jgi:hypothetical protein
VDDNLIVAQGEEYYQSYLTVLGTKFDYTEGPLTSHLGVAYHIDTEKGEISIEQSAQIMQGVQLRELHPGLGPRTLNSQSLAGACP